MTLILVTNPFSQSTDQFHQPSGQWSVHTAEEQDSSIFLYIDYGAPWVFINVGVGVQI